IILEQAPEKPASPPAPVADRPLPWIISGHDEQALQAQAGRLAELADRELPAVQVGWSLLKTRTLFEYRAVVLSQDPYPALAALARGETHPEVVTGHTHRTDPG